MTTVQEKQDVALMAHLLRRAGFGATADELDHYMSVGYEATVEALLNPGPPELLPDDLIRRYHVEQSDLRTGARRARTGCTGWSICTPTGCSGRRCACCGTESSPPPLTS